MCREAQNIGDSTAGLLPYLGDYTTVRMPQTSFLEAVLWPTRRRWIWGVDFVRAWKKGPEFAVAVLVLTVDSYIVVEQEAPFRTSVPSHCTWVIIFLLIHKVGSRCGVSLSLPLAHQR
jgi:hypothetical protein